MTSFSKSLASQRGISMIEALLATFLLSIALLGAASVQTSSMKQASAVTIQSQADLLARQMMERMRINPAGVTSGSYNSVTATTADPGCIASGCNSGSTIAQTDINQWYTALSQIPGGSGSIAGGGPGTTYTVTVTWTENAVGGAVNRSWALSSRLP